MHHHGYAWLGEKQDFDEEGVRRPPGEPPTAGSPQEVINRYRQAATDFPTSGMPPTQTAHWLMKPPSAIRGTWAESKEAGEWLSLQLA